MWIMSHLLNAIQLGGFKTSNMFNLIRDNFPQCPDFCQTYCNGLATEYCNGKSLLFHQGPLMAWTMRQHSWSNVSQLIRPRFLQSFPEAWCDGVIIDLISPPWRRPGAVCTGAARASTTRGTETDTIRLLVYRDMLSRGDSRHVLCGAVWRGRYRETPSQAELSLILFVSITWWRRSFRSSCPRIWKAWQVSGQKWSLRFNHMKMRFGYVWMRNDGWKFAGFKSMECKFHVN